jgi:RES domain-containing protein
LLDVEPVPVTGTWWRHIPAGGDISYRPKHPPDGRWQRGEVIEGLYLADSPDTAWAEWYRALAEAAMPPRQRLPRDLWKCEVSLTEVANLTDDVLLARVGLPAMAPSRSQWAMFQAVGQALFGAGWRALVSRSAARPVGRSLCVFRTAIAVPGIEPIPPPLTIDDAPVVPQDLRT